MIEYTAIRAAHRPFCMFYFQEVPMVEIGGIKIDVPLALAPMAGVTDLAFRTICREQGAGLTCTEMVSAKALCFQDKKSIPLLQLGEGEHPAAAQIFGSDLVCMEEAAAIAHEVSGARKS